ncbi:carbohydrate esterase family 5 protein [Aspergillus fischeri NRRL 181]|uniref:Cutinase n=1 Tax=Neosartorya fischeri (strain ATCC 1020 / DSM 3700 / CBS 544.65 / FGSC A1164 / JCM 1740 / NRRL 181 / WB 181) TaxID=331117 RepID=A1DHZ6_NEOFI|nr:cutinase family protein [Aspergillus fischeri NRRL 181]EAW19003.1 cutinase family protein [Aspergillus fischeri NRRL 181]
MKVSATTVVLLAGLAAGAPTKTIHSELEKRQFGTGTDGLGALASIFPILGGGGSSTSSGLGALASLIPGLGGSSSSGSGFSLPGFTLPTSIPGLGSLGSLGSSGSSSGASGLSGLSGLGGLSGLNGLSASTTDSSAEASTSGTAATSSDSNSGVALSGLLGGSITENGVKNKDACQPLTFIFARGTSELGNMGSIAGPPVATKLRSLLNNKVVVQGVDYPASIEGNAMLGAAGGPTMASLVKQALSQCPDTKVVVGGYSQGAMVVHNAANSLSEGQIAAAVLFGDPFKSQAVGKVDKADVKEYCAAGDPVCLNGVNVLAHLSYGDDAAEAAQFLVTASGVKA